jgi:hypothetical protein
LGAALVELGHPRDERGTRSQQRADVPLTETAKQGAAPTIDEHYGLASGSFAKFIADEHDRERREEAERKRHIVGDEPLRERE